MIISTRWTRAAGAVAAAAAVVSLAAASPAPARTAATTDYTEATYLQHALGLPAGDTDPAIEPVTYDRFQWLLQQSGNLAVLIGDPATDGSFAQRAQDVEAAAKERGVGKVYWFDPNLSGNAQVGSVTEPNLDIRNPDGITSIAAASRVKYGNAWQSLVGHYLGNGLKVVQNDLNSEKATVTVTTDATVVNDTGATGGHSTKVGDPSGGALYDYTGGTAPANAQHSFFFIYNQARTDGGQPAKIVSWTDLTSPRGAGTAKGDVAAAIDAAGGAGNLASYDQFAWWKSEVNAKQLAQAPSAAQGSSHPVLTDADAADGWRVDQVTYPELVDLLKSTNGADAVILFGGTWCPNTRPVLPFVNKYAQQNGVKVYNFDTVLDGGLVGGTTTSSVNPLQSRNTAAYTSTANANPSFLYGDLVSRYLSNVKTEYDYTKGDPAVTYYANGGTAGSLTSARKLQVPFLIGYSNSAVTRQWIIDNGGDDYTEYMSQWWYTNPQPNELGITTIPLTAPIWAKLNSQLASFTWQSDPTKLYPNAATEADDTDYLVAADTATVTYTPASGSTPASVKVASGGASPIPVSPAALASALAALGSSAPASLDAAKAALIAAQTASPQDPALIGNLNTVVGAWGVAQTRKTKVLTTWGSATAPNSVAGGLAAVHALDVFFAGLPDAPVTVPPVVTPPTPPVTPPSTTPITTTKPVATVTRVKVSKVKGAVVKVPTSRKGGRYKVTITAPKGKAKATGKVTITLKKGKTTKKVTGRLKGGVATVTLPKLARGTWKVTITWPGDTRYRKASATGASIKVKK